MPSGGIRSHNLSRRAAADPRLTPRGYWDRLHTKLRGVKLHKTLTLIGIQLIALTVH